MCIRTVSRTAFLLTIAILFSGSFSLQAQGQQHEVGLRLAGFQDFDFIYKKKKAENKYVRLRLISANFGYAPDQNVDRYNAGLALALGIEHRKPINEKLHFIHGIEPSIGASFGFLGRMTDASLFGSLGYVLGFQYDFSPNFYVNLETIPALNANIVAGNSPSTGTMSFSAGFNSNLVALSLAYRFGLEDKDGE